jgi:hypothetical protein
MWEMALLSLRPGDAQAGRLSARRLVVVHCGHVVRRDRDARWHAEAAVCATPVGTSGGKIRSQ